MVRIDGLLFGYRRVKVDKDDLAEAVSILLRGKINVDVKPDGEFIVRERDAAKMRELFLGKIEYSESETLGFLGKLKKVKYKAGLITALVFSLFLVILSSNLVWDIRVEGNEKIPDSAVVCALWENGFCVGDFWWSVDRSKVEASVLSASDTLSWININRRGTVAYVKVKENESREDEVSNERGYANVVADADCVIEEITVKCGTAAVKVGDSVKAGDLLISGISVTESGAELCYAEGSVKGRVSDTVSVFVNREHSVTLPGKKELRSVDIKIFGFSINILKRYGKEAEECVIIEETKDFSLFGKCKLPLWLTISSAVKAAYSESAYTDEELIRVASSRLNSLTATRLSESDLIRIRTLGEYTDGGYIMKNEIVFLREVGKVAEFSAK